MDFKTWLVLNEVLDQPVPYRWEWQRDSNWKASFAIDPLGPNQAEYEMTFYAAPRAYWSVEFVQVSPVWGYGITKTGNAGQVLATVKKIMEDFVAEAKPFRLEFSSHGQSRTNLYTKMLKKYASNLTHDVKLSPSGTKTYFGLNTGHVA